MSAEHAARWQRHEAPHTPPYHWGARKPDGTRPHHYGTADPSRCPFCSPEEPDHDAA